MNLKKVSLTAALMGLTLTASATQLSPEQALSRVTAKQGTGRNLPTISRIDETPVLTVKSKNNPNFTGVYVFNADNGYMVVSADDCALPLLAYSENGSLDINSIPPQLQYWLDFYTASIEQGVSKAEDIRFRRPVAEKSGERKAIEPFIRTKWDQDLPYNLLCPDSDNGKCITGCVATAMAQAMKYYEWPKQGTGSKSYFWDRTILTVDFSKSNYDWANMLPVYDASSTENENLAVAKLMYDCGVAVEMNFSPFFSGASSMNVAPALYNYFGYDKSMATLNRYVYTDAEWDDIVYNEIASGRPVLYSGDSKAGGHEFICDGYSGNGYYHFNWGWGGVSDGYFLLSALDPYNQGLGGSLDDSGFEYYQQVVINMMPAKADSKPTPALITYGNVYLGDQNKNYLGGGETIMPGDLIYIESPSGMFNFACTSLIGEIGIKLTPENGQPIFCPDLDGLFELNIKEGVGGYYCPLPENLADGRYNISYAFLTEDGDLADILLPLNGINQYELIISNGIGKMYISRPRQIVVDKLEFTSPIYIDKEFSYSITATNPGSEAVYTEYYPMIFDDDEDRPYFLNISTAWPNIISLEPGETRTFEFSNKFDAFNAVFNFEDMQYEYVALDPGTYYLYLNDRFSYYTFYTHMDGITLKKAVNTEVETSIELPDGGEYVDPSNAKFVVNTKCTEGYFTGKFYVLVYGYNEDGYTPLNYMQTPFMMVDEGETKSYPVEIYFDPMGFETCMAAVGDVIEGSLKPISEYLYFKIDYTGTDSIMQENEIEISVTNESVDITSDSGLDTVEVVSLSGNTVKRIKAEGNKKISISTLDLPNGGYLIVATEVTGKRIVRKIIK